MSDHHSRPTTDHSGQYNAHFQAAARFQAAAHHHLQAAHHMEHGQHEAVMRHAEAARRHGDMGHTLAEEARTAAAAAVEAAPS
jgi:hypothetical protein